MQHLIEERVLVGTGGFRRYFQFVFGHWDGDDIGYQSALAIFHELGSLAIQSERHGLEAGAAYLFAPVQFRGFLVVGPDAQVSVDLGHEGTAAARHQARLGGRLRGVTIDDYGRPAG